MTSVSVMAGNFPLALALEPGSSSRSSLGIVVIGGVLSSLILTMLLVPNAYVWMAPKNVTQKPKSEPEAAAPQPPELARTPAGVS